MLKHYNTSTLLTPLPPWRRALIRLSHPSKINLEKISKVVVMDPILCAKLLSSVNGNERFHGKPDEVIHNVLAREKTLLWDKLLTYNASYYKVIAACPHFSLKKYWRDAISVATAAYQFCKLKKLNDTLCVQAYFAGVLHNIGLIVLTYMHPVAMNTLLQKSTSTQQLLQLEKERFGQDHSAFGAEILKQQQVPEPITNIIQDCERPLDKSSHSELSQTINHALEWQRSRSRKQTSLGQRLDAHQFRQFVEAEQHIINMSDIFSYETPINAKR